MFEDNAWDGFYDNDDHIVPHTGDKHNHQFVTQGDSCKKSNHDLRGIRSSDYVNSNGTQNEEELYLENMTQKERMLDKDSWSHSDTPEGVFSSCNSDSSKDAKRLTSDDTGMPDHCFKNSNLDSGGCELCTDDTILGDKCLVEDDSVCQYPINHISQADNELSFLDNDGWLDIGNFEDVDRMLSCDLTFGMGSLNNEEEFCWLSSSQGAEGSDDALKSDFKFSCAEMSPLKSLSDYNMDSKENTGGLPINDSSKRSSPVNEKVRSQMDAIDNGGPAPLSMFSESDMKSGNIDDLLPKEKLQRKLPKPLVGRRKNGCQENVDSVHPYAPPEQYGDTKQPFGTSSSGVTSLDSIHKHKLNIDSDSLGCIQTQIPVTHPEYGHTPNQTSLLSTLSGSRSERDGHLSPSLKESSYASNMESSQGHSLEAAALKTNEKREKLYHCHDGPPLSRSFKNEDVPNQMPFHSPGSAQQVGHQFETETEGHSEVQGISIGFSPEIDSSTVQESSSMSSAQDHTSLEATSFCHLQQIMDQLDIRTKLCIRDSLYRLAKSAEQRHNNSNANGCIGDNETCKAIMVQDASRCTGFMDMETDTNPIDRSVAHLLFHRPSDPSMLLPNETIPLKSSAMIHGSVINSPVKTEKKQACQEDSSTRVEKKF
ncbi:hypothetical protein VNO77_22255 [Canavalia gladiata]|uniref:Protein LNK1 n=1 Tax=Canavalia gladiata TaxID=3824 RepID=A0AAN9QEA6_CANGL